MPLYSVDARSGHLKHKYERSPRIWIITDAADIRSIPREIRTLARDERRVVRDLSEWLKLKGSSDAALVWLAGDRFLEGNAQGFLKSLHSDNRRSFVVVNTPCVEEVPFLTVQPRTFASAASVDHRSFRVRIESSGAPPVGTMMDPVRPIEPWAQLVDAISSEKTTPGAGVDPLLRLWESRKKLPDPFPALVSRNLIATMLLHRETDNARKFLGAGVKLYPAYAELHYLAALFAIRERRFAEAPALLERAKSCGATFPGSGGEASYRCDWLFGVLALQVGDERSAFQRFITGVKSNTPFEPSLTELLKLSVPLSMIESQEYVFMQAARCFPQVAPKIVEYLMRHRAFDAARRIAQTIPSDAPQRDAFERKLDSSMAPFRAQGHRTVGQSHMSESKRTVGVVFEGAFFEYSSLARVNREIANALLSSGNFEVRLEPAALTVHPPHLLPYGAALGPAIHAQIRQAGLTIRHQWPPNFRRTATGKLAVILPWEYGGVPRVWIDQIQQNVDELWVPSNFVRDVFVQNGVDAARVVVIPNGYDPQIFSPAGASFRPQGSRDFIFLFVGGAIYRKGIDLLLEAYKMAFSGESVTLLLLVSGSSGAYRHNSLIAKIQAAVCDPNNPQILSIRNRR